MDRLFTSAFLLLGAVMIGVGLWKLAQLRLFHARSSEALGSFVGEEEGMSPYYGDGGKRFRPEFEYECPFTRETRLVKGLWGPFHYRNEELVEVRVDRTPPHQAIAWIPRRLYEPWLFVFGGILSAATAWLQTY